MSPGNDKFGVVSCDGDGQTLTFERRYSKSVAQLWAALTVPERIADWLAQAEVDLRVGGVFRLTFPDHDFTVAGQITELEPERVIAWTWPDADHPDSVVRWELFPNVAGCRLRLTQTRLIPSHLTDVAAGLHTHLEGLLVALNGVTAPWRAKREREVTKLYAGLSGDC